MVFALYFLRMALFIRRASALLSLFAGRLSLFSRAFFFAALIVKCVYFFAICNVVCLTSGRVHQRGVPHGRERAPRGKRRGFKVRCRAVRRCCSLLFVGFERVKYYTTFGLKYHAHCSTRFFCSLVLTTTQFLLARQTYTQPDLATPLALSSPPPRPSCPLSLVAFHIIGRFCAAGVSPWLCRTTTSQCPSPRRLEFSELVAS